jgi:hypothetical protein
MSKLPMQNAPRYRVSFLFLRHGFQKQNFLTA